MEQTVTAPVIIELGRTRRRNIRQLRQGRGRIIDDVNEAIGEVGTSLGDEAQGKQLVPIVLVYRKRRGKRKRRRRGLFPVVPC